MGNPYEALRWSVHAAVSDYYRHNVKKADVVLVQMTPAQCREVVAGMRHDPTVFGFIEYPVEQMVARQLEGCTFNGTWVQVQIIRDVKARIIVGCAFALDLEAATPSPASDPPPDMPPAPNGATVAVEAVK